MAARRREAPPSLTQRGARAARGRLLLARLGLAALALRVLADLDLLGLELLDEIGKGARLDDLVELCAVVRAEAHALDVDVVHQPLVPLLQEAIVDGDLSAALREEAGGYRGRVPVHALRQVLDLLAAVQFDLGDVRALEEITEERDELRTLLVGQGLPVAGEGAPSDLVEVEDVVGDLPDGGAPLRRPLR